MRTLLIRVALDLLREASVSDETFALIVPTKCRQVNVLNHGGDGMESVMNWGKSSGNDSDNAALEVREQLEGTHFECSHSKNPFSGQ